MKKTLGKFMAMLLAAGIAVTVYSGDAAAAGSDVSKGLIGYWNMNEGSGTKVADQSGNGRNLEVKGNSTWTDGKEGKAFQLDGTNFLLLPSDKKISENAISISMDIKFDELLASDNQANMIMSTTGLGALGTAIADMGLYMKVPYFGVIGTDWTQGDKVVAQDNFDAGSLKLGQWYTFTAVYNPDEGENGTMKFYINGKLDNSLDLYNTVGRPVNLGIDEDGVAFGGYFDGTALKRSWKGAMDEVRIYNRALSTEEVQLLAEGPKAVPAPEDNSKNEPAKDTKDTAETSTGTTSNNPATGDVSNVAVYGTLMLAAAVTLVARKRCSDAKA